MLFAGEQTDFSALLKRWPKGFLLHNQELGYYVSVVFSTDIDDHAGIEFSLWAQEEIKWQVKEMLEMDIIRMGTAEGGGDGRLIVWLCSKRIALAG